MGRRQTGASGSLRPPRPLTLLGWFNVVVHLIALGLTAIGIRPGTPLEPLRDRLAYLAGAPWLWTLGWSTWIVCALALVAYLAVLGGRLTENARLAQLGLMLAVAGAGFDLCCDALYMLVFPTLAASPHVPDVLFLTVERATGIASMVIANGAYSVSIFLFTRALQGQSEVAASGKLQATGFATAGFGLLLTAAGFTGDPWHAAWTAPPTIVLFCVWAILVARAVEPSRSVP